MAFSRTSMKRHEISPNTPAIRPFAGWRIGVGISPTTAWRWRKDGVISTINVNGRLFITDRAIAEFERRAVAGNFAKYRQGPRNRTSVEDVAPFAGAPHATSALRRSKKL